MKKYRFSIAIFLVVNYLILSSNEITTDLGQKLYLNEVKYQFKNFVNVIQEDNTIMMEQIKVEGIKFLLDSSYIGEVIGIYKRNGNKVKCIGYRDHLLEITLPSRISNINLDSMNLESTKIKFWNLDSAINYTCQLIKEKKITESSVNNLKEIFNNDCKFKIKLPQKCYYKMTEVNFNSEINSGIILSGFDDTLVPPKWNQLELVVSGYLNFRRIIKQSISKDKFSLDTYLQTYNKNKTYHIISKNKTQINGLPFLEIHGTFLGIIKFRQYILDSNDFIYVFSHYDDSKVSTANSYKRSDVFFHNLLNNFKIIRC